MNLSIMVSIFIFLIAALAPLFEWNLGDFHAIAWGLFFFALGHIWPYVVGPRQ